MYLHASFASLRQILPYPGCPGTSQAWSVGLTSHSMGCIALGLEWPPEAWRSYVTRSWGPFKKRSRVSASWFDSIRLYRLWHDFGTGTE